MSGEAAKLEYTTHAVHVMTEREIPVAWVEWVIDEAWKCRRCVRILSCELTGQDTSDSKGCL